MAHDVRVLYARVSTIACIVGLASVGAHRPPSCSAGPKSDDAIAKLGLETKVRMFAHFMNSEEVVILRRGAKKAVDYIVDRDYAGDKSRKIAGVRNEGRICAIVSAALRRIPQMGCGSAVHCRVITSCVGSRRQRFHTDYHPTLARGLAQSLIIALDAGVALHLKSARGEGILHLPMTGDAVIFDHDVVHAGAAYTHASNMRMHAYVVCDGASVGVGDAPYWDVSDVLR